MGTAPTVPTRPMPFMSRHIAVRNLERDFEECDDDQDDSFNSNNRIPVHPPPNEENFSRQQKVVHDFRTPSTFINPDV